MKLKETPDGDGSMLDNSLVIYGTPLSNVMLSLLHALGHDDLKSFGDSEGTFSWD